MREKLLADWQQKYERIQWELKDNERKLDNVIKRQKSLPGTICYSIAMLCISVFVFRCFWFFRYNIIFLLYYFYCAAIVGLGIAAVLYHGYHLIRGIKRYLWHVRKWDPMTYPKPETVRSNYPLHIPLNYYAERACIEWLLHQYTEDLMKLIALKRKIENTPEQSLEPIQEELEHILIYERVGRAKL